VNSEQRNKFDRLCQLLDEAGLDAIVLTRQANIAWMIGGRAHIPTTIELSCLDLIVTRTGVTVVTNVIEAPRLIAEELNEIGEVIAVAWWEGRAAKLPHGARVGVDVPDQECVNISEKVETLRRTVNYEEIEKLRLISADSAQALFSALESVTGAESEVEVAGIVAHQLWNRDLEPVVLLVAGQERALKFRHFLPTRAKLGDRVCVSICARRKGLIASATRIATFGEISDEKFEEYERLLRVEAAFLDETRVGQSFGEVLAKGVQAYVAEGFNPNEWHHHHQGGSTGYLPRDWPATPSSVTPIVAGNVIAWNPTALGWKVEDTLLVGTENLEILTFEDRWPSQLVSGRQRPGLLRH
jgi:Xaa-Pro aminopeptidase